MKTSEKRRSLYIAPPVPVTMKTVSLDIKIGRGKSKLGPGGLKIQDVTANDIGLLSFVVSDTEDTGDKIIPAMIVETDKNSDSRLEKNMQIVSVNGTATLNAAEAIELIQKAQEDAAPEEAMLTIEVRDPFFKKDDQDVRDAFLYLNSTSAIESEFYVLTTFFEKDFILSKLEFRYDPDDLEDESEYPTFPGAIETRYRVIRLCKWINPALGVVVLPPTESFIDPLDGTKLNYNGLQYYSGCVPRFAVIAPKQNSGCMLVSEEDKKEAEKSDASEMSEDEAKLVKFQENDKRRQAELKEEERKERRKRQTVAVNDNIIMVQLKLEMMDSLRDDKEFFGQGIEDLIEELQKLPGVYVLDPFIVEQLRGTPECTVWNHALMKLLYNDGEDELTGHGVLGLTVKKAYEALSTLPLAGKAIEAQRQQLERIHLRGYTLAKGKEIPHEKPI